MKQVAVIGDQHFGSKSDSIIIHAHQEEFYTKVFWPEIDTKLASGEAATDVLILGDVTDRRKFINYQTSEFAKRVFFRPALDRGLTLHWILGNHDLPLKHSLTLSSSVVFREFTNIKVYDKPALQQFDDVAVLMLPWLCDQNYTRSMELLREFEEAGGTVVAGHFEFAGFEPYRGLPNINGMDTAPFQSFPLVMSGHYHHRSTKGNIHYLGTPYELTWSDHGEPHGFHWWTPLTHELEFITNPHHLFYKFFYNDTGKNGSYVPNLIQEIQSVGITQKIIKVIVKAKTEPTWYDAFVDALYKLGPHDLQIVDDTAWTEEDLDEAREQTLDELDTLTLIHKFVDGMPWANTELQQDVTKLMANLYHQAQEKAKTSVRS